MAMVRIWKNFDIDIDAKVLDKVIVTLGPLCDEGDEIMVNSLLSG